MMPHRSVRVLLADHWRIASNVVVGDLDESACVRHDGGVYFSPASYTPSCCTTNGEGVDGN